MKIRTYNTFLIVFNRFSDFFRTRIFQSSTKANFNITRFEIFEVWLNLFLKNDPKLPKFEISQAATSQKLRQPSEAPSRLQSEPSAAAMMLRFWLNFRKIIQQIITIPLSEYQKRIKIFIFILLFADLSFLYMLLVFFQARLFFLKIFNEYN